MADQADMKYVISCVKTLKLWDFYATEEMAQRALKVEVGAWLTAQLGACFAYAEQYAKDELYWLKEAATAWRQSEDYRIMTRGEFEAAKIKELQAVSND